MITGRTPAAQLAQLPSAWWLGLQPCPPGQSWLQNRLLLLAFEVLPFWPTPISSLPTPPWVMLFPEAEELSMRQGPREGWGLEELLEGTMRGRGKPAKSHLGFQQGQSRTFLLLSSEGRLCALQDSRATGWKKPGSPKVSEEDSWPSTLYTYLPRTRVSRYNACCDLLHVWAYSLQQLAYSN